MKKVLQINAVYGFGSTGTIVRDIDYLAHENGFDSHVAYSIAKEEPISGYKIGSFWDKKLHAILSRISGKEGYFSVKSTRKLIDYINQLQPDVIHMHNLHSNYINITLLFTYLSTCNKKIIITQHDCWLYTGGCFHYSFVGCNKWQDHCENCVKRFCDTPAYLYDDCERIFEDRKKLLLAIPDLTIVNVSDWLSNETRKSFLKDIRIVTIHNGIDLNVFKPIESSMREELNFIGKKIILGMANKWLDNNRNPGVLDYLLENLDDTYVFIIVGCKIKHVEIVNSRVIFYPQINNRIELIKLYTVADVFVNLTWEDTFGLVNLEAQACGTPVITYKSTGVVETISSKTGILVEKGNIEYLAKKIRNIKKTEYITNCCLDHVKSFDHRISYDQYLKLYNI